MTPSKINIKGSVVIDMSGSQNAKAMTVDVIGPDGVKVTTHKLTPDNAKVTMTLDKPGDYRFQGLAINLADKPSTNPLRGQGSCQFSARLQNNSSLCYLPQLCRQTDNF